MTETLLQTAEREANEAESEFAGKKKGKKKASKPNGKANGVAHAAPPEEAPPAAEVTSEPGEQGIATQEEDGGEEPAKVWDRTPSQQEIALAADVLIELRNRAQEMGAEAVIDALLKVVDVHPSFLVPDQWPGDSDEFLLAADLVGEIGRFLCRGCSRIEISPNDVTFLWRNKKTWTKQGVQIRAQGKKLGELASFFSDGGRAVVIANYQLFRILNTRQKIAAIYHALRQLDTDGAIRPNQFEGFFDEVELFGTGTFTTDALLRRAIEHGAQRELPFEEAVDAFTAAEETGPETDGHAAG